MYWLFSWQFEWYYTDQGFELFASLLFLVWLSFEFGLFVKVCFNKALINVIFSICMGWTWINFQKFLTDLKFEFVMIKRDNASWFIIILGNRAFFQIYYIFIPTNNNSNSYDDNNCKKQKKRVNVSLQWNDTTQTKSAIFML